MELDLGISGGLSASDRLTVDSILLDQIGLEPLLMRDGGGSPLPGEVGAASVTRLGSGSYCPLGSQPLCFPSLDNGCGA